MTGLADGATEAFHRIVTDLDYPMLIVTAAAGEERAGCLVGFATQCSINPLRVAVWMSKANHTFGAARSAEGVVVHVLSAGQRGLAERFGSRTGDDEDKFAGSPWHAGPFGCPVLEEVERWFAGRVTERLDSGDHLLLVLDVVAAEAGRGAWPGQLGFQEVKDLDPGHEP